MSGEAKFERGGAPLFVSSDELARIAMDAGWRIAGESQDFAASGAAVAVVDARGAFGDGIAAVRELAPAVERKGAALLALLSRGDADRIGAIYEAGATHFLLDPVRQGELIHAIRFAERFAERMARTAMTGAGRRRSDPASIAPIVDAVTGWAARRLAAGRPVVAARVALASFDLVNNAHGRTAGDLILGEAAERLTHAAAELFAGEAIVARASGPEFLVAGDASAAGEAELAARISTVMAEPFGRAVVGVKVGVAVSDGAESATSVMRRAAEALGPVDDGSVLEELAVELHHAVGSGQIAVLFQPQVEIATGRITGVEALARWEHPRLGAIGAEALFAAGERAGLGQPLSEHVQRLALRQAARWPAALKELRLSINVTAEDVGGPDFAGRFLERVIEAGFPARRLTVEVTESGLIADPGYAATLLGGLREAGCRTAIDDFGTGYSSLAYLNALPLDYLKLDKALVSGVERDGRERVVAQGVLSLARSLGLCTIAEGVETEAQRDLLAAEGCELYQGFLCAGALDAPALVKLVKRGAKPV